MMGYAYTDPYKNRLNSDAATTSTDPNGDYSPDMVNHPPHYETGGIECIDAMRASQGDEAVWHFCICNAFKYIWRNARKGSQIQDLEKAVWYLNKAIEIEKENQIEKE